MVDRHFGTLFNQRICFFFSLFPFQLYHSTAMCSLSDNIYDYYNVSQGKITIPSMDDGEEFSLTDVSFV